MCARIDPLEEAPLVLTRREQLGLKQDKENARGRGGGRGRGRGRKQKPAKETGEAVGEKPVEIEKEAFESPRPRRLFDDAQDPKAAEHSEKASPPVKQPNKKARKQPKAKAKQVDQEQEAKETKDPEPEAPVSAGASPPVKQDKKRARRSGKSQASQAAEQKPAGDQAPEVVPEASGAAKSKEKKKRNPSSAAEEQALNFLTGIKRNDPAKCYFLEGLFAAANGPEDEVVKKEDLKKFDFWQLSMYWKSNRVGLIQKIGKTNKHVLSFGGAYCPSVALPLRAVYFYV